MFILPSVQGSKYFSVKDTMGRRRTLRSKKQRGGADMTEEEWKYHLWADVHHDFGYLGPGNIYYQIGHEDMSGSPGIRVESNAQNHLYDIMRSGDDANSATFRQRIQSKIVFKVPTETEVSKNIVVPTLSHVGNNAIGIVHDAGEFITTRLGCQNVITFGSVLDPASKPIDSERRPIWRATPDVTVGLRQYGFATDAPGVETITIRGFNGGSTMVGLKFPEQGMVDGVARELYAEGEPLRRAKVINNTSIEQSGFFTSISEASDATLQQGTDIQRRQYYYRIGKTLGDAMLVESLVQLPNGGVWQQFDGNALNVAPPTFFALKTLDRLNHTRAVVKGIPSIFDNSLKDGDPVRSFDYIPGNVTDDQFNTILANGYANLRTQITNRYNDLNTQLAALLNEGALRPQYIRATGSPRAIFSGRGDGGRQAKLAAIGGIIQGQIVQRIIQLRDRKLAEFDGKVATVPQGDDRQPRIDFYSAVSEFARRISPTSSVMDERNILTPKIIVCQEPYIAIPMLNMLMNIENEKDNMGDGTDFRNQFVDRIDGVEAGVGAGQQGGAIILESPLPADKSSDPAFYGDPPMVIGKPDLKDKFFNEQVWDGCPTIYLFWKFVCAKVNDCLPVSVIVDIDKLVAHYTFEESKRTADENSIVVFEDITVLRNLKLEYETLLKLSPSVLSVRSVQIVSSENKITRTSELYNAFVCWLNHSIFKEDPDWEVMMNSHLDNARTIGFGTVLGKRATEDNRAAPADVGPGAQPEEDGAAGQPPGGSGAAAVLAVELKPPASPPIEQVRARVGPTFGSPGSAAPSAASTLLASPTGSQQPSAGVSRVGSIMFSPLSQPDSASRSDTSAQQSDSSGEEGKPPGIGGLRRTYRKQKNARNSTPRISRNAKHSGLRKRKGTRRSRRV